MIHREYGASFKVVATDTRYFTRSKLFRNLDHKKNFSLMWQAVFKLEYTFCQERYYITFEVE